VSESLSPPPPPLPLPPPAVQAASNYATYLVLPITHAGAGSFLGWYHCTCPSTPATDGPPCTCPSTAAPGNLPAASVPQFILFTVGSQEGQG